MKKFLTFVFLLLGISFLGTDPLQAYCNSPGPNAAEGSWGRYKNCVERERWQAETRAREQRRQLEEQRRQLEYERTRGHRERCIREGRATNSVSC